MKKRMLCFCLSLLVICGGMFSHGGEYKGEDKKDQNQQEIVETNYTKKGSIQEKTVEWEYPITPDNPEWKKLGSVKNKIEACRIPVEILEKMTDEQLVQAIMEFPFLIDVFAANSEQAAVKSLERTCDAYRELLSRSSACEVLLNEVKSQLNIRVGDVTAEQMITNDALAILILYQDDFGGMLSEEDVRELAKLSSLIEVVDELDSVSVWYPDSYPRTPSGFYVDHVSYECEHDTVSYHEVRDQRVVEVYDVELISVGTCKYNCHSYAWHSQSASNIYWIPNPKLYMMDPAYKKVMSSMSGNSLSVNRRDIVFYGKTTAEELGSAHSAVIVSEKSGAPLATREVQSKWGALGVFKHSVAVVPDTYDTNTITVWHKE